MNCARSASRYSIAALISKLKRLRAPAFTGAIETTETVRTAAASANAIFVIVATLGLFTDPPANHRRYSVHV